MTNSELILLYQKLFNHDILKTGKSSLDYKIMTLKEREFLIEFYNSTGHHFWKIKLLGNTMFMYMPKIDRKKESLSPLYLNTI